MSSALPISNSRKRTPGHFGVLWKVPAAGDRRLGLYLPPAREPAARLTEPVAAIEDAAYFERWQVLLRRWAQGTDNHRRRAAQHDDGCPGTDRLGGRHDRNRAPDTGTADRSRSRARNDGLRWRGTYFMLGVEHILGGIDHLLFVLALMLLIRDPWMLVKTITAFTLAHSITLTGAALGYVSLPQTPVEAAIALSIAFVARELIRMQPGERRLSEPIHGLWPSPSACCTASALRER